ncbi:PAS domain S-box protein [bacterium]|nr:PAS domain S-box protein [bacterium]
MTSPKFKDLVEMTTDWIWEINKDGIYTYVSPKVKDILGYEVDEVIGKTPFDLMPKDEAKRVLKFFREKVIKKESFFRLENVNKHKDGHLVTLETNGMPILDERGDLIGYRGIDRDITERKKMEEVLWKSEDKYRTLLKNLPQKIFLKDKNSVYISCNENYARDLKIKSEEIAGKTDYDFFPKELAEKYRADDKRIMKSGETEDIEEKYIQEGQEVIVHTVKTPVKDEEGNVFGILGIFWDITGRKKMEEEIRVYAQAIEGADDAFLITDRKGKIIFMNQSVLDMYGYRRKELLGKHVSIFPSESSLKKQKEAIREAETKGNWSGELINKRKSGEEFPIILNLSLVRNEKNEVVGLLSVFRDITETKKLISELEEDRITLEEKVREKTAQIRESEKMASLGRLSAGVAHEINNPITSILLNVQRMSGKMKKEVKTIPDFKAYVKTIEKVEGAIYRCRKIVTGLLAFSHPAKPELTPTNINKVIKETLESLEEQVKTRDIKVVKALAPQLPRLMADGEQLSQVFSNLIMNSCEAMPKGGRLRITTRLQKPEVGVRSGKLGEGARKLVEIEVSDMGKGISEKDLPKIFDPFFTTKETGKGVGLGLSISYGIIEEHKGTIEVRSQKGKGTIFIVRLPAVKKDKSKINA